MGSNPFQVWTFVGFLFATAWFAFILLQWYFHTVEKLFLLWFLNLTCFAVNFLERQWRAPSAWVARLLCNRGWGPCGAAESDFQTSITQSTDWWLVGSLQEAKQSKVKSNWLGRMHLLFLEFKEFKIEHASIWNLFIMYYVLGCKYPSGNFCCRRDTCPMK